MPQYITPLTVERRAVLELNFGVNIISVFNSANHSASHFYVSPRAAAASWCSFRFIVSRTFCSMHRATFTLISRIVWHERMSDDQNNYTICH